MLFSWDDGGVVYFLDGARACAPMSIDKTMVEMILEVGEGTISHEGEPE